MRAPWVSSTTGSVHLTLNQEVPGSSPGGPTKSTTRKRVRSSGASHKEESRGSRDRVEGVHACYLTDSMTADGPIMVARAHCSRKQCPCGETDIMRGFEPRVVGSSPAGGTSIREAVVPSRNFGIGSEVDANPETWVRIPPARSQGEESQRGRGGLEGKTPEMPG